MKTLFPETNMFRLKIRGIALCTAAILSACGGATDHLNAGASDSGNPQAMSASGTTTLQLTSGAALPADAMTQLAQPAFHLAPVLLDTPDDVGTIDNAASSRTYPRMQSVPSGLENLVTRGLTMQMLKAALQARKQDIDARTAEGSPTPMAATGNVVTTYSPAQIRAAYGMPALPFGGAALTPTQSAQLGAGQTIYIIDAMTDPNIASELAAFNQKFGLPTCTTQTIATTAALPLAAASLNGCVLSVVRSTQSGAMTASVPAYDSGWATETALDVEWSHATAPLARIILINAASSSTNDFLGAINLANAMGAGSVSMSFGSPEGNWTASVNAAFTKSNMTYFASAGDSGASVQWPAVSPNVVAVGGTTLTYSGVGPRSEAAWSESGGGISLYTPTPGYQNNAVPGMGSVAHRSVSDVSFNAAPNTGQYVAIITPGSSTVSWGSAGGTSLGAPQWAGIIAAANASRALSNMRALGDPHTVLYAQISSVPGTYASEFDDVTQGADGNCSTCSAKVGYDQVTGLGTPNVTSLLTTLSGTTVAASAPVVTSAGIGGQVGTALSFTVSAADVNPLTYALTGAPSGMTISTVGVVSWATPAAGTYSVMVTARDTQTGLSGSGIYTITIAPQPAPVVASTSIKGQAGAALSFTASVSSADPITYTLGGAPSGMVIGNSGIVTWAAPVAGTYLLTVNAKDTKTGLSGQGVFTVNIASAGGPVITAAAMKGVVGKSLTGMINVSDPNASWVSISISGAPIGMMFSVSGVNVAVAWTHPVLGSYTLKLSAVDSAGRSAVPVTIPVTITAN